MLVSLLVLLAANEPMLRGLRARSLEATSAVENMFAGLGRYVRALDENEALRTQNIDLANQVALMRAAEAQNERLEALLELSDSLTFEVIAARVTSKDITGERNNITLDVGTSDGITEDMAVIDPRGIVGKVTLVSERNSRIMTYLNTDFFTPANVLPSMTDGILRWDGNRFNRLILEQVVQSADVSRGDEVVTNGYSTVFQPAYPIGVVDSVFAEPGMSTWTIYVTPYAELDNLSHVFVVKSIPDSHQ